jgi:hypothetical protein
MFRESAASRAARDCLRLAELFEHFARVVERPAVEAADLARRPVQLEHEAVAGYLVQAVDVLGDDAPDAALRFPTGERPMGLVRLGVGELDVRFRALPPIRQLCLRIPAIILEQDWLGARPNTPGRAKVRNSALSADPGAREDHAPSGPAQPVGGSFQIGVQSRIPRRRDPPTSWNYKDLFVEHSLAKVDSAF